MILLRATVEGIHVIPFVQTSFLGVENLAVGLGTRLVLLGSRPQLFLKEEREGLANLLHPLKPGGAVSLETRSGHRRDAAAAAAATAHTDSG